MKILKTMALSMLMPVCANAQSTTLHAKFDVAGNALPAIRHMTDMKMTGDTLLFVYEGHENHGQRCLRRAVVDRDSSTIKVSPDMGKRDDGYYVSYMPLPFIADNGSIRVIGQDDCEIYSVENDTAFVRTRQYLMDGNSPVPFPLSLYAQDVFMTGPDKYVFIGREPKGGRQYAMKADLTCSKIDTIRQINISPELQAWMPNMGEMAYLGKHDRLAFAYMFHPIVEIFDTDGNIISSVRVGKDTFNPKTLEEADFHELNHLHFIDITTTDDYIYALHNGYSESSRSIYKIDWNGNIISCEAVKVSLQKIAVGKDNSVTGWTGNDFIAM
ncbi:hypothetical protein [uncultured Duncaniella sp.]|uniref:hypothetical protein n=1 Tax=uncultured Duncaniella sp. TaxID=2768039 RepID=UPI0025A9AA86|nr:hypothetical protein [uncultured Duncaniella sp.]